ncbi:MAG: arsenate reductase (glutaredoxin) [Actinomycetota bacterium]|nr:arsenate reductase (glutaredoxin) [Actinomycetota bacterium]
MPVKMYFNPSCSKCQNVLGILRDNDIEPEIVEYLKEPPSEVELREILQLLGIAPRQLLCTGEPAYRELGLADPALTHSELIGAIVANPSLLQRPIVIADGKAVIGRPPEQVLSIL